MTEPVVAQATVFALTIAIGLLLGFLFDCYRVTRGRLRPGPLATILGDLLFWLVATGVAFALLIVGNWGELRLYVWVGFLLGAFSYRLLLSRTVIALLVTLFTLAERVVGMAVGRAARLARLPGEWGRRFWHRTRLGQTLQRWWRWTRGAPGSGPPPSA
ncbi:MAG: spore cortex biosynthesis protein YabQ [Bacillota bacterium]|nr:spore cortex biosynthesis protein YabQ [Bacillota bacterium]